MCVVFSIQNKANSQLTARTLLSKTQHTVVHDFIRIMTYEHIHDICLAVL